MAAILTQHMLYANAFAWKEKSESNFPEDQIENKQRCAYLLCWCLMLRYRETLQPTKEPRNCAQCGYRSSDVSSEATSPAASCPRLKDWRGRGETGQLTARLKWTGVIFNICVLILNCAIALAICIFVVLAFNASAQGNASPGFSDF